MSKPYLINYNSYDNPADEALFVEAITSNFIAKKVRENTYVIVNDKNLRSQKIFELIESKLEIPVDFIVVKLEFFYGIFSADGLKWLKETFSDIKWLN